MKTPKRPFISLTTDFDKQSRGIGAMKGVILGICPEAKIVDLVHGVPDYNLIEGARALEGIPFLPVGFHVAVIDPGVGTQRKAIAIKVKRGDILIGPDNGVMLPAARFLGGITEVREITSEAFMRKPVSPVFHGRDLFGSSAAHLAAGKKFNSVGAKLKEKDLVKAPYMEAKEKGGKIECSLIHINKFGNVFLNLAQKEMQRVFKKEEMIEVEFFWEKIQIPYVDTFGEVGESKPVILDDDFGRVSIALNQKSFAEKYRIKMDTKIILIKLKGKR